MDINDIHKIVTRKRIHNESEKLREKVARENAKIIKLSVAQDTAYWDLREKLQQVEGNHEKLQQNMVTVQMQHEALSGQYQEELRLRPETLNKLSSTREICDVLENYTERLKDTLSRCKEDQAKLCETFQRSGRIVREVKAAYAQEEARNRDRVESLQDKVKLMHDHQNQLIQSFTQAKQQADAEIIDLRSKLTLTTTQKDELIAVQLELNRTLDRYKFDIEKKDEKGANLQAELNKLMQDFNSQASQARDILAQQEKEIKEIKEENKSLQKGLENQEEFTKSVCDQNKALQEKISVLESENICLVKDGGELNKRLEGATNLNQSLQISFATIKEEKDNLIQEFQDTKKVLIDKEEYIKSLELNIFKKDREKADISIELNKVNIESEKRSAELEKVVTLKLQLEDKIAELEATLNSQRSASENKLKELESLIETKDHELDAKALAINQMMTELKNSADIRSKLEGTINKTKRDMDKERDSYTDKENNLMNTIKQLEKIVRGKDDEISKQLSTILETRKEKERLQERLQTIQDTIDGAQQELRSPPASRLPPDQDDNAVNITPAHQRVQPQSPPAPAQFAQARARGSTAQDDDSLFNFMSDSSAEDSYWKSEVKRRYEALTRGEQLPPMAPALLRRRRGKVPVVPAIQNITEQKRDSAEQDPAISLSQLKLDSKNKGRLFFKNKRGRK